MGSNAIVKAFRPRNIGAYGMVVSIDMKNMVWFDKLLHKYYHPSIVRKIIKHLPKVGAIRVLKDGNDIALIVITPKADPKQYRIDHYTGDAQEADFSIQMTLVKNGADFKDLSPNINRENFKQVANFVMGIYVYEYLMHTDSSAKTDEIVPFEVFGEALV